MELMEVLCEKEVLTELSKRHLEEYSKKWGCSPYGALIDSHIFTESELANLLANILQIDRVYKLSDMRFSKKIIQSIPYAIVQKQMCMPIQVGRNNDWIKLVFSNPVN